MNENIEKRKNFNEEGLRLRNKKQFLLQKIRILELIKQQQEELEELEFQKQKKK